MASIRSTPNIQRNHLYLWVCGDHNESIIFWQVTNASALAKRKGARGSKEYRVAAMVPATQPPVPQLELLGVGDTHQDFRRFVTCLPSKPGLMVLACTRSKMKATQKKSECCLDPLCPMAWKFLAQMEIDKNTSASPRE